ncbi:MAG: hypothetical protein CL677_09560 [Bdellovibrionaceae bacterium]|nr:hypothetical protein [Pseudobdellovibrionaceae bacterium]|tara:strand:- start:24125 stop:24355 length:231 start_codon:yes stop_codon:yes gene_type:complete
MEYKPLTPEVIDQYFPYFVFLYGALVTIVLNVPRLVELAEERLSTDLLKQMQGHRYLAVTCLCLGFFWSLQNIWYY